MGDESRDSKMDYNKADRRNEGSRDFEVRGDEARDKSWGKFGSRGGSYDQYWVARPMVAAGHRPLGQDEEFYDIVSPPALKSSSLWRS